MTYQINDPEDIDWAYFWAKKLEAKKDRGKDWNKAAPNFGKSAKKDDYHTKLIERIDINKEDTLLDLGCGEGSITIPLAKRAKSVTGVDSAYKMLEILNEKSQKENIINIKTIEEDLTNITVENVGKHDIVIASRSLNGVLNIKETIANINEIANKYVYITVFGSSTHKYKKEKAEIAGKPFKAGTDHMVLVMLLRSLGIEANVLQLECKNLKEYHSIEEAIERSIWRLGELEEENKIALENYFKDIFVKNKRGNWVNPKDKTDLVLIWWKKEE